MKNTILLATLSIAIMGCASPESKQQVSATQYNCSNVSQKIAHLEQEKGENDNRVKAGIETFLPASAVVHLVQGTESTKYSVTTGEWGEAVDAKLTEMKNYQKQCY